MDSDSGIDYLVIILLNKIEISIKVDIDCNLRVLSQGVNLVNVTMENQTNMAVVIFMDSEDILQAESINETIFVSILQLVMKEEVEVIIVNIIKVENDTDSY